MDYLDNGGNLYIESVNIGTDHETTTFFDYLGISLKDNGNDYEVNTLKGNCAGCTELLKYYYLGGISPHYLVDRLLAEDALPLLSSEEGHGRMFIHETDDYKVISSSVVIGAIANSDSLNIKPYLLSEFVNYFIGYNPITSLQENVEQLFSGTSFPNPFSSETTIVFDLEQRSPVTVQLYDMSGRLVNQLADAVYGPGRHTLQWDATNQAGERVDKGFYFCRIQSGNQVKTHKIIVVP